MNQDLRGLSVSLNLMEVSQSTSGLSKEEIATIEAARFEVPVVADTYEIRLTEREQTMTVPMEFKQRVGGSTYTWVMYKADSIPDLRVGVQGDVWIDSTPGGVPRIFVFGERSSWHEWDDPAQASGQTQPAPDLGSVVAVYHPWLRHRRLEFDGAALRWGIVDEHGESDMGRLEREVAAAGLPRYGDIPLVRVAERLCTAAPPTSGGRIVIPPYKPASVEWWKKPVDPAYVWRSPPTSPSTAGPSQSCSPPAEGPRQPGRPFVINPNAFSLAKKAFPPPGAVPIIPAFQFPPLCAPALVAVAVKTEEEEENAVLAQLQRTRESVSPSPPQQPSIRVKAEPDESNASLAQSTGLSVFAPPGGFFGSAGTSMPTPTSRSAFFGPAAHALVSRTVFDPQNAFSTLPATPIRTDVSEFLGSLPLPLNHREQMLGDLGISSMKYLKSFADAPPAVLSKFTVKLQEQGFTFIEALVLRDGLSPLRDHVAAVAVVPTMPESVYAFLAAMRPSMTRHAPIFAALGIDVVHLPILARLDAAPYGEFEQALLAKGVSWADAFLVEVALKTRVLF